jgi:predicted amidohydrolase
MHSIGGGINLGLSICYDVRFGALYRTLAQNGANILLVPSAFTVPTGEAHWHVLLRARAIENGCYVVAAAQCGTHDGGRKTYGHSLIIDPWGRVLADGGDAPGIIMADINLAEVVKARTAIPSLRGDRPFSL